MEKAAQKDDVPNIPNDIKLPARIWKDNNRQRRHNNMDIQPQKDQGTHQGRADSTVSKEILIAFISKKLKQEFESLKQGKFEDKELYNFIGRAIDDLKKNPTCGIKIPRKLWPKAYIQKYGLTNLWKYDLPNAWRLIYTIETDEIRIVNIILEWFDHKDYEKRFKY